MHGVRKEPNLNFAFFGHEFSKEDKDNLRNSGNMGRIVDLYNQKSGENVPSVISIDRKTNDIISYPAEWIKVPDEIKGVKLDENQKQTLHEGKPLYLEAMISKKGEPFNANVQFNADKKFIEFLFDKTQKTDQKVDSKENKQENKPEIKKAEAKKSAKPNDDLKLKTPKPKGRKM